MKNRWFVVVGAGGALIVLFVCLCVALIGVIGPAAIIALQAGGISQALAPPTETPVVVRPTIQAGAEGSSRGKLVLVAQETLATLQDMEIPINDPRDLAFRLEGKENIPLTFPVPSPVLAVGTRHTFWVTDVDTNESFQVQATLRQVTDHSYFWVQDEVAYAEEDLQALAQSFESEIYPTTREFFGSEWTPGIDEDPRLYVLFAEGLGSNLAGYFSSTDEMHPLAHDYSNAHEMFLLNADNLDMHEEFTYSVLAHEFQHMIHWFRDRNETSWINEGFSELAVFLNGFEVGSDRIFIRDPDLHLNDWPNNEAQTSPHYGAAFLFLLYFMDRFGEDATRALAGHPANGLESVDLVLQEMGATDPVTGKALGADDVFLDWALTSYLNDLAIGDGRYDYRLYPTAPQAEATETIHSCPQDWLTRDVHQYGVDYIRITCRGDYRLRFEGSTQSKVVPVDTHSGNYAFWSNKGDESDMTLTRTFDFRNYSGPLSLSYWTWFDLEQDYDYVYVSVSEDGERWRLLTTPSGTPEDPTGNSYGWGYNGVSDAWIQERIDLTDYAGKQVQVRFEYVTDAAVNGEGMLLDDIAIPEIGYFTDFENGAEGWEAKGWARIQNVLPQDFRLALIRVGDNTSIEEIRLAEDRTAEILFSVGDGVDEVVLLVTGTTRFTRQPAAYRLAVDE